MRLGLFTVSITLLLVGCDKYQARKWSGTYECKVHYHYWDGLPTLIDSNYMENIEVTRTKDKVIIFGNEIPVDSLRDERLYYEGYVHDYIRLQFEGDSIHYLSSSGGLGGNGSYEYRGIRR